MQSVTVTKKSVTHIQGNLFNIVLNMQYLNSEDILIDTDISEHYALGENRDAIVAKFKVRMQKEIDNYKVVQVIFNSAVLDTAVTALQNDLEV